MEIDILSLFPNFFSGPFQESILKRAQERNLLKIRHVDLRDFGMGKWKKVDDPIYGGGPGMLLRPEPIKRALESVKKEESYVVALTPQGELLTSEICQELAGKKHLICLCGHYEGIDERILAHEVDREISIGDYVLTNGNIAAIVLVDAVSRFLPGVLGNEESFKQDSFSEGILDAPHYTRPENFEGKRVPSLLLEGDHGAISKWRKKEALKRTHQRRPDLYASYIANVKRAKFPGEGKKKEFTFLLTENFNKSLTFFCRDLKCHLLFQDEEVALFEEGFALAKAEEKAYPVMLTLKVEEQKNFEEIATLLIKKKRVIGALQRKGGEEEIFFTDLEGNPWRLYCESGGKDDN